MVSSHSPPTPARNHHPLAKRPMPGKHLQRIGTPTKRAQVNTGDSTETTNTSGVKLTRDSATQLT